MLSLKVDSQLKLVIDRLSFDNDTRQRKPGPSFIQMYSIHLLICNLDKYII